MAKNSWALPDGYDAASRKALNELFGSLKNANTHITPEAYEELRRGNTQAFMGLVNWQEIGADFASVQEALRSFAAKTGLQLYTGGEIYSELLFDLVDERAVIWAKNHTADLVTEITDEMRQQIRDVMAEATQGQLTYSQAARKIKTNLALTTKDSAAVDAFYSKQLDKLARSGLSIDKATAKATARADRYAAKLLRNRSRSIARTEIANAASEGRKISWETGVADGYIDPASLKEWVAESDACKICGPMDGVTVPYNKDFPSGVMMPPQHPNCRCAAVLLPPETNDEYWTAYAKDSTISASSSIRKSADDSYKPTQAMITAAERALRWKDEGKAKGAGTPVGWGRATDIAAGRSMSLDIVKRMFSFFSRHEVDKQGKDFKNISNPSNGRIMWDAWGGDAGFTWSEAIVEREKKLEKHGGGSHDERTHGNRSGSSANLASYKESTIADFPKPTNVSARAEQALSSWYDADYAAEANRIIRGDDVPNLQNEITYEVAALVGATESYQTTEPLVVRRYATTRDFVEGPLRSIDDLPSKITYRGITPTSAMDTASWLDDRPFQLRMHLPAGTKGVARTGGSPFSSDFEHEFLLAPNSTFRVENVGKFDGRSTTIDLVLVDQTPYDRTRLPLDKHQLGGHDQRTHGNRSGGRQSYASSADLFSNQKSIEDAVNSRTNSGTSQFQNGAVATQVLLENQGRGGKPQVFEGDETKTSAEALREANPDAVLMFRGTDEAYKNSMLNNETDRTGTGVFGEGYYFTNDYNEAQNYASQGLTGRHANPATIVAALSPTAKVKTFKNLDEIVSFGKEAQNEALRNMSFDTADFTLTQFYGMHSTAATTKLILEGFDAMTFQGYNDSQFTVVFDRGALQVAAS